MPSINPQLTHPGNLTLCLAFEGFKWIDPPPLLVNLFHVRRHFKTRYWNRVSVRHVANDAGKTGEEKIAYSRLKSRAVNAEAEARQIKNDIYPEPVLDIWDVWDLESSAIALNGRDVKILVDEAIVLTGRSPDALEPLLQFIKLTPQHNGRHGCRLYAGYERCDGVDVYTDGGTVGEKCLNEQGPAPAERVENGVACLGVPTNQASDDRWVKFRGKAEEVMGELGLISVASEA